jgi:hypothetical protein
MERSVSNSGEKRAARRSRGYLPAEWETPHGKDSGMLRNVSTGGCYVESLHPVAIGWPVRLAFRLPSGEVVGGLRVVAHRDTHGFGLRFTKMKDGVCEKIEELLRAQPF